MAPLVAGASTSTLTMFTFDELIAEIAVKKAAAQDKDSWERLRTVAQELAAVDATDEFDVVTNHRWSLVSVSINGFRGVLNATPLELFFDTEPGVTVLHGPNGAGKSSITDAIELALIGKTTGGPRGTGGNLSLWDPVPVGRGSAGTSVSLVLASGESRLYLSCQLDSAGTLVSRDCEVEDGTGRRPIALGKLWAEALASYSPVFAYATLERRVQLSKDLQSYFESLLALGGCFTALKESIEASGALSAGSMSRWKEARDAAQRSLGQVDADWATGSGDLLAVRLPNVEEVIDAWLTDSGLLESGTQERAVASDALAQLRLASKSLKEAVDALTAAALSGHDGLAVSLQALESEAVQLGLSDDRVCPVCGATDTHWMPTLVGTVAELEKAKGLRAAVVDALRTLKRVCQTLLVPILSLEEFKPAENAFHADMIVGARVMDALQGEIENHGATSHQGVVSSAVAAAGWIDSGEAEALVSRAIAITDRLKQWRIARAIAVADFLTVWRETQSSAVESAAWQSALKRVEDLRKHLRALRTTALEEKASERVQALLSDVGLSIDGLAVNQTTATMNLVDGANNTLALGMLSAGQRNAVLLAPLLASVDAGPFAFVILDDPVHAFDELRIDRLAETLTELAAARRVIVLTHDERLREHLVARPIRTTTKLVSRDVSAGTVAVEDSDHFWSQLLDDAMLILELTEEAVGNTGTATDSVRGLCRQSLDNGIREFVVMNAIANRRDPRADLAHLDSAATTAARLDIAEALWVPTSGDINPVVSARQACAGHLEAWNRAVHGDAATSNVTKVEIRSARAACKVLTRRRH